MKFSKILSNAEWMLLAATFLWGGTFAVMKSGLDYVSSDLLTASRFTLAAIVFIVIRFFIKGQFFAKGLYYGFLLGLILYFSFAMQTEGLIYTTASRSSFITQLLILFTPFVEYILFKRLPERSTIVSILVILIGLFIFSFPQGGEINLGDFFTLLCAISFALYIVLLDIYSKQIGIWELLIGQTTMTAALAWFAVYVRGSFEFTLGFPLIGVIVYLAFFATNLAIFIQTKYQYKTGALRASVIYTMEPIFSLMIAFILLGEIMSLREAIGAIIMILGFLYRPFYRLKKYKSLN